MGNISKKSSSSRREFALNHANDLTILVEYRTTTIPRLNWRSELEHVSIVAKASQRTQRGGGKAERRRKQALQWKAKHRYAFAEAKALIASEIKRRWKLTFDSQQCQVLLGVGTNHESSFNASVDFHSYCGTIRNHVLICHHISGFANCESTSGRSHFKILSDRVVDADEKGKRQ